MHRSLQVALILSLITLTAVTMFEIQQLRTPATFHTYSFYKEYTTTGANFWDVDTTAFPSPTIATKQPQTWSANASRADNSDPGSTGASVDVGGSYVNTTASDDSYFYISVTDVESDPPSVDLWTMLELNASIDPPQSSLFITVEYFMGAGDRFYFHIYVSTTDGVEKEVYFSSVTKATSDTTKVIQIQSPTAGDINKVCFRFYGYSAYYYDSVVDAYKAQVKIYIDFFQAKEVIPTTSVSTATDYVYYHTGALSSYMGYAPLVESSQSYGYIIWISMSDYAGTTYAEISFGASNNNDFDIVVPDFCMFVSLPSPSPASPAYEDVYWLHVQYVFSTWTVDYYVYSDPSLARTTTEYIYDDSNKYLAIRINTPYKTFWIGIKDYNYTTPSELAEKYGLTISDTLQKIIIKLEGQITTGDTRTAKIVIDWLGNVVPQGYIQSISYRIDYKLTARNVHDVNVITLPTINYDTEAYKFVYFFYDTRYPTTYWVNTTSDYNGDGKINQWDAIYCVFDYLEYYLTKMGYIVSWVDADELKTIMETRRDVIVIVINGALPDTVYQGNDDNIVKKFLREGGIFVWGTSFLGKYYGKSDGSLVDVGYYQDKKIFGTPYGLIVWYGARTSEIFTEITPLGKRLGLTWDLLYDIANTWRWFEWHIHLGRYNDYVGDDYYILMIRKHIFYTAEGIPSEEKTLVNGIFKFGEGYFVHVFPQYFYHTELTAYRKMAEVLARVFLIIPRANYCYSFEIYNDTEINATTLDYDFEWTASVLSNQETDESGTNGWGENFDDISDWTGPEVSRLTVSSGIAIYEYTSSGQDWSDIRIVLDNDLDLTKYPFLEIRWGEYEENCSESYFGLEFWNTTTYSLDTIVDIILTKIEGVEGSTTSWFITRINLFELCESKFTKIKVIRILVYHPQAGSYVKVKIDWIRIYGIKLNDTDITIHPSLGDDIGEWAYNFKGFLIMHSDYDNDGYWDDCWLVLGTLTVDTNMILEIRYKVVEIDGSPPLYFWIGYYYNGWKVLAIYEDSTTSWKIKRWNIPNTGSFEFWISLTDRLDKCGGTIYIDYIKIGYLGKWVYVWDFDCGKYYEELDGSVVDSVSLDKVRFSEKIPYGILDAKLGVLLIVNAYEDISNEWMFVTKYLDVAQVQVIHTYSTFYYMSIHYNYTILPILILPFLIFCFAVFLSRFVRGYFGKFFLVFLGFSLALLLII